MRECVHVHWSVVWDSKIIPKEPLEKHKEGLDAFAYNEVRMGLGGLMTISTEGTWGQVPAQSGCGSKFLITIKKTLAHYKRLFFSQSFFFFSYSFITFEVEFLAKPVEFQKELAGICTCPSGRNVMEIFGKLRKKFNGKE